MIREERSMKTGVKRVIVFLCAALVLVLARVPAFRVNEAVMIRRIDQQMRVNRLMIDKFSSWTIENKQLYKYLYNYVEIITTVSTVMCIIDGSDELLQKRAELWKYIEETNAKLYKKLRHGLFGTIINLPGKAGRKIGVAVYHIAQKVVGFN